MGQDFYQQLDVPRTASQSLILEGYLARIRELRPGVEVNPDHHKVRDLNIAYTFLSDPEERKKYDLALSGELCPWCGQRLPDPGLEDHVAKHVATDAKEGCIVCGRLPARLFRYKASSGLVLWRKTHRVEGNLCKTCSTGVFRAMQARNLARGPWGVISFFAVPYDLVQNWLSHRKALKMPEPEPRDPVYDNRAGIGRGVFRRPAVWASLLALATALVFTGQAVLGGDTPSATGGDVEVDRMTSTTIEPNDGWIVGDCARFDLAGRVLHTTCGDHFATVIAVVPTASECPQSSDFSVPLTEGVACFEEA